MEKQDKVVLLIYSKYIIRLYVGFVFFNPECVSDRYTLNTNTLSKILSLLLNLLLADNNREKYKESSDSDYEDSHFTLYMSSYFKKRTFKSSRCSQNS